LTLIFFFVIYKYIAVKFSTVLIFLKEMFRSSG